jgi:hypothetical protein
MRILRGLTSRLLPCGCLAGVYETYDGAVVTLLDDRGPNCTMASHVAGNEVPELAIPHDSRDSEVALHADGQGKP